MHGCMMGCCMNPTQYSVTYFTAVPSTEAQLDVMDCWPVGFVGPRSDSKVSLHPLRKRKSDDTYGMLLDSDYFIQYHLNFLPSFPLLTFPCTFFYLSTVFTIHSTFLIH